MGRVRIGTSGWSYEAWRGVFFPQGLAKRRWLAHLARVFDTVEINGSFYQMLRPATYARYYLDTPEGFLFAVKGGRFITHNKKLKDVDTPLANFFATGVLSLADKLGPILWQLPNQRFELERVTRFLEMLPKDTGEASRLAHKHDHRLKGRASYKVERSRPLRHALEIRHPSLFTEALAQAARAHGVALVVSHSGDWHLLEEVTADFIYIRLHGAPETYQSGYGPKTSERWAQKIQAWASGSQPADAQRISSQPPKAQPREVYVYFDNDARAYAPRDALRLTMLLEGKKPQAGDRALRRLAAGRGMAR